MTEEIPKASEFMMKEENDPNARRLSEPGQENTSDPGD